MLARSSAGTVHTTRRKVVIAASITTPCNGAVWTASTEVSSNRKRTFKHAQPVSCSRKLPTWSVHLLRHVLPCCVVLRGMVWFSVRGMCTACVLPRPHHDMLASTRAPVKYVSQGVRQLFCCIYRYVAQRQTTSDSSTREEDHDTGRRKYREATSFP